MLGLVASYLVANWFSENRKWWFVKNNFLVLNTLLKLGSTIFNFKTKIVKQRGNKIFWNLGIL